MVKTRFFKTVSLPDQIYDLISEKVGQGELNGLRIPVSTFVTNVVVADLNRRGWLDDLDLKTGQKRLDVEQPNKKLAAFGFPASL